MVVFFDKVKVDKFDGTQRTKVAFQIAEVSGVSD